MDIIGKIRYNFGSPLVALNFVNRSILQKLNSPQSYWLMQAWPIRRSSLEFFSITSRRWGSLQLRGSLQKHSHELRQAYFVAVHTDIPINKLYCKRWIVFFDKFVHRCRLSVF